jgi:uncharacterized protein (TIRG00374 family)
MKQQFKKSYQQIKKQRIIKYFKKIIPIIGIIILLYLIIDIGVEKIVNTFLNISPLHAFFVILLTFPRVLLRNIQWQLILKKQKIQVSFLKSLKIFLIGYFYGSITPGYLGQIIRIPYMKDATREPLGKLFVNSFIETAVHGLSLYIMMLIGAFVLVNQYPEIFIGACIFVGTSVLIYTFFIKKERGEKAFYLLIKLFTPKKLRIHLTRFVNTFYNDFPRIRDYIIPFLIGIPAWIIIYSQIYIIGISLEIDIPYFLFLVLYPIANIVAFIPISSAGLGTREITLVLLFSLYGISPEKTIVLSLAGHLLTDVLTGFYGLLISVIESNNKENLSNFIRNIE